MINKIRNRLLLTNTAVLMAILLLMAFFIYRFFAYTYSNDKSEDLISLCHQSKRFADNLFVEKKDDFSYNEELSFFKERIINSNSRIAVFDDDFNVLYSYGKFKVKKKTLANTAKSYFADPSSSDIEVVEQDGKYVITEYSSQKTSFKSCTTLVTDKNGNMRIIMIANNSREARRTLGILFSILALTVLLGSGISLIGGYFTADRALVPIKESINNQKQFIADASHELRTPIAVIKTNLDLIESNEDETVKSQETWIDYAKSETSRMDKIVGDLLILSKADLGEIPFENRENDLVLIIKETIEKMQPIAGKKEIAIYMACPYSTVTAKVDADKFSQLLIILIDNAVKYSAEKTKILVSVKATENSKIVIKVKDEGIGIAGEDLDRIFERFYRVDKARSRKEKGTGLGLSIAQWISENIGADLSVESVENRGSSFIITIPLVSFEVSEIEHS